MPEKLSNTEICDIIEVEGLYYAIRHYLSVDEIEDEILKEKIEQVNILFDEIEDILYEEE